MSEETEDAVSEVKYAGLAPIQVSASVVHKAVRNILKNEMNFDPNELRAEARDAALAVVTERVDKFLKEKGYGSAELEERIVRFLDKQLTADRIDAKIDDAIRRAVASKLGYVFEKHLAGALEIIVRDGIKVRVCGSMIPVKFERGDA